jgi:hypothetical protein
MRILALAAWLLLVPVFIAYHLGPGQTQKTLDATQAKLKAAQQKVAAQDYAAAVELYEEALRLLPPERRTASHRIRLERDKAMLLAKKLPKPIVICNCSWTSCRRRSRQTRPSWRKPVQRWPMPNTM